MRLCNYLVTLRCPAAQASDVIGRLSSAATRCATDPLCLIFSMLPVRDFFIAQRCCRSWRALRLKSESWPCEQPVELHMAQLRCDDEKMQLRGACALHKLLCIEDVDKLINRICMYRGGLDRLVQMLQSANQQVQYECLCVIKKITSGTPQQTTAVAEAAAIPLLVRLLAYHDDDTNSLAACALGNIAVDSIHNCELVLAVANVIPSIRALCTKDASIERIRIGTWLLHILSDCQSQPAFSLLQSALPVVVQLLSSYSDEEVLQNVCCTLMNFSATSEQVQSVIDSGVTCRLIELLSHQSDRVQYPALCTIHNITTDVVQSQAIIDCGGLPLLRVLLTLPEPEIYNKTCGVILNIISRNKAHIEHVIGAGIIPKVVAILQEKDTIENQKAAAQAISYIACNGSNEQVRYLAEQGVISPLCELIFDCAESILSVGVVDSQSNGNGRNVFADQVRKCGGHDFLHSLRAHELEEVRLRAKHILSMYFQTS